MLLIFFIWFLIIKTGIRIGSRHTTDTRQKTPSTEQYLDKDSDPAMKYY